MAKYLDDNGLLYFWQKIKNTFTVKADSIKNITRSGTTFTATRADGTTFTFTQQDNDTTYTNMTAAEATTGTITTGRVISAKVLNDKIAEMITASAYSLPVATSSQLGGIKLGNGFYLNGSDQLQINLLANDCLITDGGILTINNATQNARGAMSAADKAKLDALPTNTTLAATYATKSEIVGLYKYKGSVATASALPASPETGDVYNIEAASAYGAAGANVAWNGTAWDSLGEIFTITSITNAEIDTIVAS